MSGPEQSSRDQLIDRLRADNARLVADNAELRAENKDLAGRLARLERLISRNSGNSSMPPSLDDLPGRTPPAPKPPGGVKRGKGKQKGAPGAALSPVEHPGRRVPAYPERCGGCQAGLDPLVHEVAGILARQQIDVPLVTATVTEYRCIRCGAGAGMSPGRSCLQGSLTHRSRSARTFRPSRCICWWSTRSRWNGPAR